MTDARSTDDGTEWDDLVRVVELLSGQDELERRAAAKALFASANDRSGELAAAPELLGVLLAHPDPVVEAWGAGVVGRVAADHPDTVADTPVADELRGLLEHDARTVQHNALEALAALVGPRPDAVAPAADALRTLLCHEDVAIQHNAAGVLGRLAEDHPDAVVPAVGPLRRLRNHDEDAVASRATAALAQLAREPSDVIVER